MASDFTLIVEFLLTNSQPHTLIAGLIKYTVLRLLIFLINGLKSFINTIN